MALLLRLLVIAGLFFAGARQSSAEEQPKIAEASGPITILVLTDLSGKEREIGQQTSFGAKLVLDELKDANRKVRIVIEDHRGQGEEAQAKLRKHLREGVVDAVYVDMIDPSRAVASILKDQPRLLVYVGRSYSVMNSYRYAFKTGVNINEGCRSLALYFRKLQIENAGLLQAVDEIGDLCRSGVAPAYPDMKIARYSYGDSVFEQVLGFKRAGVTGLFNATYEPDFADVLKVLRKTNTKFELGVNEDAISRELFEQYQSELDGVVTFGLPTVSPEFIDKVIATNTNNSFQKIQRAAMAYLHLRQLYDAITGCHYLGLDCQLRVLKGARPDPSVGFLGWTGWEGRTASFQVMLKRWKKGKPELVR